MLSHLGHSLDRLIAENVPGIHAVVGGHDHELLLEPDAIVNPAGDTTWIVQAGAFYEYVGRLRFEVDGSTVRFLDYAPIPMTDDVAPEEPTIKAIVEQLAADEEEVYGIPFYSQAVASAEEFQTELITDLTSRREASTNVTRLVTKAFKAAIPCDIAITACGATAQPIQAGPVTPADLFRTIGYGFNETNGLGYRLASFTLSGLDLMKGLEYGLSTIEANDEFFVVGEHLRYYYDPSKNPFERLDSVFIDNQPIDPGMEYSIVSSEFILVFMRDLLAPELGMTVKNDTVFAVTEFEALLTYVSSLATITGDTANIIVGTELLTKDIPFSYTLEQNFPNPFNPSTSIRFALPEAGIVQLEVFDLLGRRVELLVGGMLEAGSHSVTWRSNSPSGVYFYRLEVKNAQGNKAFSMVRRMALLR